MVRLQADLNYMKAEEGMPGGTASVYLADTLLKLQAGAKLTTDKEYGIKGYYVEGNFIKCRNSAAGVPFTMVFDQQKGFDNINTNLNFLKDVKALEGSGTGMHLPGMPNVKFSNKNFADKLRSDDKLHDAYCDLLTTHMDALVVE